MSPLCFGAWAQVAAVMENFSSLKAQVGAYHAQLAAAMALESAAV